MPDDSLSQEEIDALMSAVNSGDVDSLEDDSTGDRQSDAVAYDFKRPKLISKDQKRTIQMLYDTFSKYLASAMSMYLRTNVHLDVTLIEQFTYGEYIMSLPETTCINLFSMAPLEGLSILEMNMKLVTSIVDRLMGGFGESFDADREITEIEKSIVSGVVDVILGQLYEAWKHIIDLEFRQEGLETKPQFAQIVGLTSNVLLVQFSLTVGKETGSLSICMPFDVVVPILGKLTAQQWMATSVRTRERNTSVIRQQIPLIKTGVSVELGKTRLSIRELLDLRKDDVLLLDQAAHENVLIRIGDMPKYRGKPGMSGNKLAVQILEEIE